MEESRSRCMGINTGKAIGVERNLHKSQRICKSPLSRRGNGQAYAITVVPEQGRTQNIEVPLTVNAPDDMSVSCDICANEG